jgi:hypothetical protein
MEESKINDFFKHKGEYSHTRLISIIGSFVIFGSFIYYPSNSGLQNLMAIIISASLINATASKFSKQIKYDNESASDEEVWDSIADQSEHDPVGCTKRTRNRRNS